MAVTISCLPFEVILPYFEYSDLVRFKATCRSFRVEEEDKKKKEDFLRSIFHVNKVDCLIFRIPEVPCDTEGYKEFYVAPGSEVIKWEHLLTEIYKKTIEKLEPNQFHLELKYARQDEEAKKARMFYKNVMYNYVN
jgi:hypothetical protein